MIFLVGVISDLKKKPAEKPAAALKSEITEEDEKASKDNPEFAVIDLDNKLILGEEGDAWYPLQLQRRVPKEEMEAVKENERFVIINVQNRTYFNPVEKNWLPLPIAKTEEKKEEEKTAPAEEKTE